MASRKSLTKRKGVLDTTHEILERLEAHLRAISQFTVGLYSLFYFFSSFKYHYFFPLFFVSHVSWQVTANMRGSSAEEVAERVLSQASLSGLQVKCHERGTFCVSYVFSLLV